MCVLLRPLFHITDDGLVAVALPLEEHSRIEQCGGSIQPRMMGNLGIEFIHQICMLLIDTVELLKDMVNDLYLVYCQSLI